MTDKEIRALIERRRKDWRYGNSAEAKYKAEECKDILELMDEQEESVSGNIDFEQELYNAFGQVKDFTLGMQIAKWFYDMGRNSKDSQEPVSKDLEEASKEWLKTQLDKSYSSYGETKMMELTRFDGYAMLDAIEFGAQWQLNKIRKI